MGLKLSENLVQYIKEEVERVGYGRITIELNETSQKIDVITEHRKRFPKEETSTAHPTNIRQG